MPLPANWRGGVGAGAPGVVEINNMKERREREVSPVGPPGANNP